MGGMNAKNQNKEEKKGVVKALQKSFKLAQDGQLAALMHLGSKYFMMREDILQNLIQNQGKVINTPELIEYNKNYQILLHMMQSLDTSEEKQEKAFNEIDAFTFDFSQHFQGFKKDREKVLKRFLVLVNNDLLLKDLYKQIEVKLEEAQQQQAAQNEAQRVQQQKPQQVQNHGKLT